MTDYFSWFTGFFELVTEIFQGTCDALNTLVTELNTTAANIILAAQQQDFVIAKTLGAIRYIIGDVMYQAIFISISLGAFYSIYKIVTAILKLIKKARESKKTSAIDVAKLIIK